MSRRVPGSGFLRARVLVLLRGLRKKRLPRLGLELRSESGLELELVRASV